MGRNIADGTIEGSKLKGRLKVLWIEDNIDKWSGTYDVFETKFSFQIARTPARAAELVEQSLAQNQTRESTSELLPADIYLTDFRLHEGTALGEDWEKHPARAPSAGFLVGVLTALRWSHLPQAIMPYSGFSDEFGATYSLTKMFLPSTLILGDAVDSGKAQSDLTEVLREGVYKFRCALIAAHDVGRLGIKSFALDGGQMRLGYDADDCILVNTESGLRSFALGSLFFDELDEKENVVPKESVVAFLNEFERSNDEGLAAEIASRYWSCYNNRKSLQCWAMALNPADRTHFDCEVPHIGACHIDVPSKDRKRVKRIRRLAIYYLLFVKHIADQLIDKISEIDQEEDHNTIEAIFVSWGKKIVDNQMIDMDADDDISAREDVADALQISEQAMGILGEVWRDSDSPAEFLDEMGQSIVPRKSAEDYIRLLWPYPKQTEKSHPRDYKFNKAGLVCKQLSAELNVDLAEIVDGNARSLVDEELNSVRRFALSCFSCGPALWPDWLKV